MLQVRRTLLQRAFAIAGLAATGLWLSACGAFFQCEGKADCGTSTTGTGSSGDYAYVSNSASGPTYVNEYSIAAGALTTISGSPVNLGYTPSGMVVAPTNNYMYIAQGSGLIYEYSIGTGGALAIANSGNAVGSASTGASSMDVSPDGNWLFVLDDVGLVLYQFPITPSSGLLGSEAAFTVSSSGTATPQSVRVSPNGNYVAVSLGTDGTIVFPYSSSAGIGSQNFVTLSTGSTAAGDFAVAMDTNNYLYVARTTGPAVYLLTTPSANVVSATSILQSSLTNGNGPHSVTLSSTSGGVVYLGNLTDSTISAYGQSAGKLTNVSTTAYTAPTNVSSLARDNSAKYIIAAGYNSSSGIQLYTIGTNGALTSSASAASGTSTAVPALVAVTH